MTKAKEPKNPGCAPKIWKKFSVYEKKMWTLFYESFKQPYAYADQSKQDRDTIAHNHACQAIWEMEHRNADLGKCNPYEMLMVFADKVDGYTPEMRRLFDRLAFVLFQEYVVCGDMAVNGVKAKIRLYDWKK
jgi:hypothetical protein